MNESVNLDLGVLVRDPRTNAIRKAARTALQVTVAAVPMILLSATNLLTETTAATLTAALTPVAAWAQNALEDKGIIGTILRTPTPASADAAAKVAAKAS